MIHERAISQAKRLIETAEAQGLLSPESFSPVGLLLDNIPHLNGAEASHIVGLLQERKRVAEALAQ